MNNGKIAAFVLDENPNGLAKYTTGLIVDGDEPPPSVLVLLLRCCPQLMAGVADTSESPILFLISSFMIHWALDELKK